MTPDDFRPALGQRFDGPSGVALVLHRIDALGRNPATRPFALVFTGDAATQLPPDMHLLSNEALGELSLFLSPFKQDGDRISYEAVFN